MRVLVVGNFYMSYNRRILHGVATYARLYGWELVHVDAQQAGDSAKILPKADALLVGVHRFEKESRFSRKGIPTVGWSAAVAKVPWPRILTDNVAVGRMVAEQFLLQGYRQFAFCPNYPGIWSQQRLDGFTARLKEAGLGVHVAPELAADSLRRAVAWIKTLPTPIALMLSHDPAAAKILAACVKLSRRVPEDIAIIGVGNDELVCEITNPPLSSVSHQTEKIGYEAAAMVHRMMKGNASAPEFTLMPPGDLVVRRSSDAMAFDDPMVTEAMRFIRDQKSNSIGTKQVMDHIGTSHVTLNLRFISATGSTVAATIRRMRIEKAKQLLSTSDLAMPTIARHAGFSCARQLSKSFRHYTGQTPTGYRRQFRLH